MIPTDPQDDEAAERPDGGAPMQPDPNRPPEMPAEPEEESDEAWMRRFIEENIHLAPPPVVRPPAPPPQPWDGPRSQWKVPDHLSMPHPNGGYMAMALMSRTMDDLDEVTGGTRAATYEEVDKYLGHALIAEGLVPFTYTADEAIRWWKAGGYKVLAGSAEEPPSSGTAPAMHDGASTEAPANARARGISPRPANPHGVSDLTDEAEPDIVVAADPQRVAEIGSLTDAEFLRYAEMEQWLDSLPARTTPAGSRTDRTSAKKARLLLQPGSLVGSRHGGLNGADLERSLGASAMDQAAIDRAARDRATPITRKDILLGGGTTGHITIADNPKASARAPIGEIPEFSEVDRNEKYIVEMSKKYSVDANLIRAIIYMESTHGWYDAPLNIIHANKSIRPMNVNTAYWGSAWGSNDSLQDARSNIEGGTQLLKAILNAMPGADIAKIATVFNNTDAKKVSSYGARVKDIYKKKAWIRRVTLPSTGTIRIP
jgi:hypothetical protein